MKKSTVFIPAVTKKAVFTICLSLLLFSLTGCGLRSPNTDAGVLDEANDAFSNMSTTNPTESQKDDEAGNAEEKESSFVKVNLSDRGTVLLSPEPIKEI